MYSFAASEKTFQRRNDELRLFLTFIISAKRVQRKMILKRKAKRAKNFVTIQTVEVTAFTATSVLLKALGLKCPELNVTIE